MFNNNTTNSGEEDFRAKQEPKYTSASRQWAGFKNPRIVRVSKAFGGKDRHSKVCTVKGLRDRRIRLSVPTAIQLYDLQDRLGLNQPSKVIDWLIDSTKDDIDKLPPLQMLPGDFNQFNPLIPNLIPQDLNSPQVSLSQFLSNSPNASFVKDVGNRTLLYTKQGLKLDNDIHGINGDDHQRMKGKEAMVNEQENGDGNGGLNFFPIPNYNSYPGLMFPYYNWELPSSNLSLSQFGNNQGSLVSSSHTHDHSSTPASQFFIAPSPYTYNYPMINFGENHDLNRQNNHFHLLSSSSQHVPPNPLMPLFNMSDSQEKAPFGLDAHSKVRSHNNGDR